jgi:GH15 family glucan-1,4-alpha-glucosidase
VSSLDLAVIGNCTIAALVDRRARIVWSCFPRFDGEPVFCSLIDGGDAASETPPARGVFALDLVGMTRCEQIYVDNTAIVVSVMSDDHGNMLEVTDFAPRFVRFERTFRPPQIVRRVRPLAGRPRILAAVRPVFGLGSRPPDVTRGSSHVRYVGAAQTLRLTTDAPISYILDETPFAVDRPMSFFLGADEPLQSEVDATAREFLDKTTGWWRDWARALSIPFDWQDAVIRAAITLKLCNFEETGAIVAALTTSIPEAPGTGRNWDYRYCWLRDAYFVVHALNRLGTTRTMEEYVNFMGNVVDTFGVEKEFHLPPLLSITRNGSTDEFIATSLKGYRGDGPVRVGNAAVSQMQFDGFGAVVLAATHAFFDRRLMRGGHAAHFAHLERLGARALATFDQPDAGPWELRTKQNVHTFSAVMCWAALDRLARIATILGREDRAAHWQENADHVRAAIEPRIWSAARGTFVSTFDGEDLDATLLLLSDLDFVRADDPRFAATVDAIGKELGRGDLLLRYAVRDDFGHMTSGFLVCAFWYVDALASIGRKDEARALFERILTRRNSFGLLSEDADVETGELWGNFPQTYSMVGLINSAMRLSRSWEEAI